MRCLIIDDHPLSRDGTRLALLQADNGVEVREAASLAAAYAVILESPQPRLILLDLDLEATKGIETLRLLRGWLAENGVDARVVVLSGRSEVELVRQVIDLYGTGFILKATSREIFQHAVALTLAGGIYIPEAVLRNWEFKGELTSRSNQQMRPANLTARESEVAALLVQGFTYKRIARELERIDGRPISDHTIRAHVGNIAWKLGVTENAKSGVMAEIARRGLRFPPKP